MTVFQVRFALKPKGMTGMIVPSPQSLINQGFQAFRHGFDSRLVHLKSLKNGGFSGFFYCRYDERYDFFRKRYDWYDKMRQKFLKTPENKGFWGFRHGILDLRERRKFEWCPSCKKL